MSETSILRKGTRYWRLRRDGTISDEQVLDEDLEVAWVDSSGASGNVWDDGEGEQLLTDRWYEVR